jgi:shikimate kinase
MKKNIVLTGFMGTGKSAAGKVLASKIPMLYVSVDETIESREQKTVSEIFRTRGEAYFRAVEKEVIKDLSRLSGRIIDCGGGAVLDAENVDNLRVSGQVFCLWADPGEILKRVSSSSHRPILEVNDPLERIKELLEKRRDCYLKADFHIDTTSMTSCEVADEIRRMAGDDGI